MVENLDLNDHSIEIARKLNNKGFDTLDSLWNHQEGHWESLDTLKMRADFSLQEAILILGDF